MTHDLQFVVNNPVHFFLLKHSFFFNFCPYVSLSDIFCMFTVCLLFQITHTKTNTNIHARGGIRTRNPLDQASRVRSCLYALSQPDRLIKSVELQLRRANTDWSDCRQMAVKGALWLPKRLSVNLNFSFLNRISPLLISSSYPVVLTRLGGPRSRLYTSRKISRVWPGIEPGTSWTAVRRAIHYTKQ